jgi:aldehyde dehydrogenase (NAD+)
MLQQNDIDRIFAMQKANEWKHKASTAKERSALLRPFLERLKRSGEELSEALFQDLGRPKVPMPFDLEVSIEAAEEAIEKLDEWMAPIAVTPRSGDARDEAWLTYEARGTVLIIGPWNFPFHLIVKPLISAIAAGNSVVIKPASMAPATNAFTAKIVREVFDESIVAVFEGNSVLANALMAKPFDHIFMTGSPAVGKIVMRAAAEHLASVTLELGGKNPTVIDRTADLDAAAALIAVDRTMNGGQTCLCTDYVLVPSDMLEPFVGKLSAEFQRLFYVDGAFQPQANCHFIDERNFERVTNYVADAMANGAKVLAGGRSDRDTLTLEPTILGDVPDDALVMEEEIFGPVVVVIPYDTIKEALATIHRYDKPLGFGIFSRDQDFIRTITQNTSSGGLSINGWAQHFFDGGLPFGGVNGSGVGRYHSVHGFRELSHERPVFHRHL